MQIISHRGYWQSANEKNSNAAFARSFSLGFGVETDIRDHNGDIVIAHDMPNGNEICLRDFLHILCQHNPSLPLALNVKSDGLATLLKQELQNFDNMNYFVFDMSVPDMMSYIHHHIPFFTRMSEYETTPILLDKAQGVWLDCFGSDIWYSQQQILDLLATKKICVVSSELHGHDYKKLWQRLIDIAYHPNLMLCTDYPQQAQEYFDH